jgi:hypothetical protein
MGQIVKSLGDFLLLRGTRGHVSIRILLREFSGDQKNNICFWRDCFQDLSHSFSGVVGICLQVNGKSPLRNAYSADSREP